MSTPDAQLTHVGFFVVDLDRMVEFYSRVMGLVVTDRGSNYRGDRVTFLSRNADEHHQLVLAAGRGAGERTTVQQVSFAVKGLEDLKAFHRRLIDERVDGLAPRNHGNAWSIYFHDPEGNRVEIYTASPWHVSQPYGVDLDLSKPVETIHAETLEMIRNDPSFASHEAWATALTDRIREA
jgi:catechol-2,3-dioxygenase